MDISSFDLTTLDTKFDVILIDPPLEEYQRRTTGINYPWTPWDFEEVREGGREGGREGEREGERE